MTYKRHTNQNFITGDHQNQGGQLSGKGTIIENAVGKANGLGETRSIFQL